PIETTRAGHHRPADVLTGSPCRLSGDVVGALLSRHLGAAVEHQAHHRDQRQGDDCADLGDAAGVAARPEPGRPRHPRAPHRSRYVSTGLTAVARTVTVGKANGRSATLSGQLTVTVTRPGSP